MERVGVLIEKLLDQLSMNADVHSMLVTTQLLQSELLMLANKTNNQSKSKVSVIVPHAMGAFTIVGSPVNETEAIANDQIPIMAPVIETEPIYEPEPELAEAFIPTLKVVEQALVNIPTPITVPEPIPHFIEQDPWQSVYPNKEEVESPWALDPLMEFPTLAHQEKVVFELNDVIAEGANGSSLNDSLKENKTEVAAVLQEFPVKDLKKAITINDRHSFIRELFRGDETMYERSIKTINSFHIFAEAEYWIQRELKIKLGWDVSLELVKTFDQLVKRRFL